MSRERMLRAALLAYPAGVRERSGAEMAATALDAAAGSRIRFARESADLVRLGLRARGRETAAAGARRVIADGLCLAGVWIMTLDLSTLLAQRVRGLHDPLLAPASLVLLAVALCLALAGRDRLAGIAALVWTAARLPALLADDAGPALAVLAVTVPSLVCFTLLVARPRRRAPDPRGLAWLIVPATLVAAFGPPSYEQSPLLLLAVAVAALLVALYGLATLLTDPRVAIAGSVSLMALGVPSLALAAAAVILVAATRLRRLRRHVPI
jgi:hypothetical protein